MKSSHKGRSTFKKQSKKMNKYLASSVNPEKLSLTIKGILVGLVPLIIVLTGLNQAELNEVIEGIIQAVTGITTAIAGVMTAYGLLRKIWIKLKPQ